MPVFLGDPLVTRTPSAFLSVLAILCLFSIQNPACAVEPEPAPPKPPEAWEEPVNKLDKAVEEAKGKGDTAWMLTSSALVLVMVPGLALFYGGMVRKKNVLATMMQSYAAMAVVGLYWLAVGYSLAFGPSRIAIDLLGAKDGGIIGWSWDLFFLKGIESTKLLAGTGISVYTHVMFQGMFAIITPALISGALAERIRFWPFCIFMILWVTFVYCPLAHMVWAYDWFYAVPTDPAKGIGGSAIGLLGKWGALDFAGGTVVHIAAGTAGLAAALILRRRIGYPEHTIQPNSMVLTLIGAGLLWFGWFGFNGGSATASSSLAASAFAATQAAAAAAGLSWILVEWICKGKPTALGLASGIVAGLVAVTPASGFVYIWGGIAIGLLAGVVCYFTVAMKPIFKYDDSLDAFGVHAVGGFLGAVLTGLFCYLAVNGAGADGYFAVSSMHSKLEALRAKYSDAKSLDNIVELENQIRNLEQLRAKAQEEKNAEAEKEANDDLVTTRKELKIAQDALKKSDATQRIEKLEEEIKEKEKFVLAAKSEMEDSARTLASARETAFNAFEKGKADEKNKTKAEFDKAKEASDKKEDAFKKVFTEFKNLQVEFDKLLAEKKDLKMLEETSAVSWAAGKGSLSQFFIQVKAALLATVFAFVVSLLLALLTQAITLGNFTTSKEKENQGLDLTEHGEIGFDLSVGYDSIPTRAAAEPKAAKIPPGQKRFDVVVEGVENGALIKSWSELCVPTEEPLDPDFKEIYPFVTTVQSNRFRLRGGDPRALSAHIQKLFSKRLGKPVRVRVEE